jgi:hypothetical protein
MLYTDVYAWSSDGMDQQWVTNDPHKMASGIIPRIGTKAELH